MISSCYLESVSLVSSCIFTSCFRSLDAGHNTTELQNYHRTRMRGTYVLFFIFRRKVLTAVAVETLQWLRSVGYN